MASPLRILVLGASAAGLKAACRARRLLPDAEITVLDRREVVSFGACGLPYFLAGEIDRLDALRETGYGAVRDAEFFRRVKGVDLRTGWRVLALDRDEKAVTVERADSEVVGEGSQRTMLLYDKLVYALGARPWAPDGVQLGPAVTALSVPEEAATLRAGLQSGAVGSCVILGGGFVGVETAVALVDLWGCEVTILEATDRLLPELLDPDMSDLVRARLERAGVNVRTGVTVTSAVSAGEDAGDGTPRAVVTTAAEERLTADRAVVALGTRPRTELARAAGLAVGELGGLVVDANLATSDPDVLAAGDCLEVVHHVSGKVCRVPLGSLANRQGRVVGDGLAGLDSDFPAVVGSAAVKVLDLGVAATGLSEAAAREAGFAVAVVQGAFHDRTHFYPERENVFLKLVYEAGSERLLGLQAVGPGDVVKRVDVFAALLRADADLQELLDTEWCYAPPYNAPLDPLQGLAAAARNVHQLAAGQVPVSAAAGAAGDHVLLDVRTAAEFAAQAPPAPAGAVNIPLEELRERVGEVPTGRPILVLCARGPRSFEAARILHRHGHADVVYLAGGAHMWHAAGQAPDTAPDTAPD